MTQTLEALSRRRATLTSLRSIVHTMKTLAAINAVPYEQAAHSVASYHRTVLRGLRAFVVRTGPIALPITEPAAPILVVFGSDHGLCGNYNEALAARVSGEFGMADGNTRVLCVGARMADALRDQGLSPQLTLLPPASADGIGRLAGDLVTRLDELGGGDGHQRVAVTLAFTRQAGKGTGEPEVSQLLPLAPALLSVSGGTHWQSRSLPDYTMEAAPLLAALLRNHIFASVFEASAQALVTENAARLARMQQAEQAVDDRLEEVGAQLRLVRQDEITRELMDIVVGFESLAGNRSATGPVALHFDKQKGRAPGD